MADDTDKTTHPIDSADQIVRRLGTRYLIVLLLVALLMVVDQAVVQPLLLRLDAYAPAINLSGRQRMLSQKLTKAALELQAADSDVPRDVSRRELRETLDQWSRAHALLQDGSGQDGIDQDGDGQDGDGQEGMRIISSPQIVAQWQELRPHFDAMRVAATKLIDPAQSSAEMSESVSQMVAHEGNFLTTMDRIVKLMEGEAAREIRRLRAAALGIAGVIVVLLVGLGWFVVRPATRTIRSQVDVLETRVALRTRELADALESLQSQIAEREVAEQRNKALAAQLGHADRVASMGHLSVSLAHELNQPLGAIANYAETCDVLLALPAESNLQSRLQENVGHIKRAALRAGQIVRRIRNFVRADGGTTMAADVNVLVGEVVELCRQEISDSGVELTLRLSAQGGSVAVDPIQIQQVLVNLVQNALQAMRSEPTDKRRLCISSSEDGSFVRVDVRDSGPGFAQAEAEAFFESFRTTKVEGLGVGLAICRSIVANHEGVIWAESTPGHGAQFSFTLPLIRPHDAFEPAESDCLCG
jgi:two-component system sensor kinase FixL